MSWLKKYCLIGAFVCVLAAPAWAHGVDIFAWLENDRIIVECDLGHDTPAANANVEVTDSDTGRELLQGKMGEDGRYSFPVPEVVRQGHGIVISVNAGQGHRGQWKMDASELYAAASLTAGFDEAKLAEAKADHVHLTPAPSLPLPGPSAAPAAMTPESARAMIQETIETSLAPIRRELAAQKNKSPGLVEIIGGIGWIMGLVGVALYFKSRRGNS